MDGSESYAEAVAPLCACSYTSIGGVRAVDVRSLLDSTVGLRRPLLYCCTMAVSFGGHVSPLVCVSPRLQSSPLMLAVLQIGWRYLEYVNVFTRASSSSLLQ